MVHADEEARAERLGISKVSEPGSVAGSVPCQAPDLDLVNHAAIVPPQPRVSKAGAKRGRRASLIAASDLEIQQLALQGMQGHQKSGKLLPQLTTSSTGSTPRDNSQSGGAQKNRSCSGRQWANLCAATHSAAHMTMLM